MAYEDVIIKLVPDDPTDRKSDNSGHHIIDCQVLESFADGNPVHVIPFVLYITQFGLALDDIATNIDNSGDQQTDCQLYESFAEVADTHDIPLELYITVFPPPFLAIATNNDSCGDQQTDVH